MWCTPNSGGVHQIVVVYTKQWWCTPNSVGVACLPKLLVIVAPDDLVPHPAVLGPLLVPVHSLNLCICFSVQFFVCNNNTSITMIEVPYSPLNF